ncbi:MAG: hypothetical protein K6F87_04910 [Lachnospiraceae bacterium]|nr:hypothetical protein [Lachnospiraceae bacterium]
MRIQLSDTIDLKKGTAFPVLFHATSTYHMESFTNGIDPEKKSLKYELINTMFNELKQAASDKGITLGKVDLYLSTQKNDLKGYRYGSFYLTNCLFRLGLYLDEDGYRGIGEIMSCLISGYKEYHDKTGEYYQFSADGAQDYLETFYDVKTGTVRDDIKPVVICIYDVPAKYIIDEYSAKPVGEKLPRALVRSVPGGFRKITEGGGSLEITIRDYIRSQNSWIYDGPIIERDMYDIIVFDTDELTEKKKNGNEYLNYIWEKL